MPPPPRPRPLTPPQSPDTTETPASPPDPPTFRSPASDRSPAPPDGAAPAEEEKFEPLIGEPRTVRRDHEQPMTNKTFQDILIEQLEAAAELGNADAMYQLFLNEKMCPEDPSKADEDRAEEYLKYAYENNLEPWTAMQIMRYSRWGYDGESTRKRENRATCGRAPSRRTGMNGAASPTLLIRRGPKPKDRWVR